LYKGEGAFPWNTPYPTGIAPGGIGNTEMIADVLFRDYLLPFEIASILLLVAVVGSVFMARKESASK
jgi:NADH:ubiquinone oxidoreductase subunit 6 (subunit J)